jgi:hypothetical protein
MMHDDVGNRDHCLPSRAEDGVGEYETTPEDGIQSPPADDGTQLPPAEDATKSPSPELIKETNVTSADVAPKHSEAGAALEKASEPAADPAQPENNSPFAGIDFSTQVAILMCHNLPTRRVYNFVQGATKEQVDSIFKICLPDEIVYLEKFLP